MDYQLTPREVLLQKRFQSEARTAERLKAKITEQAFWEGYASAMNDTAEILTYDDQTVASQIRE